MKQTLDQIFKLQDNHTTIKKEFLAGFTTFITMAYIIFVNPQIMALSGMDQGAIFVGTCLAAAIACFVMGFFANWPIGLAPGMGLNAFFTYTVVGEMGYSWQVALGAVFLAGVLFFIMSITRLRAWMISSIPLNLRIAMGAGVGLFIGLIGLKNGGIIVGNQATLLSLGEFSQIETLLAAILCYTPGLTFALGTRPLKFLHWMPGIPYSIFIFLYDETRKKIMRSTVVMTRDKQTGQVIRHPGWVERNTYY